MAVVAGRWGDKGWSSFNLSTSTWTFSWTKQVPDQNPSRSPAPAPCSYDKLLGLIRKGNKSKDKLVTANLRLVNVVVNKVGEDHQLHAEHFPPFRSPSLFTFHHNYYTRTH